MKKIFILLIPRPVLMLQAFCILFCLFDSEEIVAQVITPPNYEILASTFTTLSSTANSSVPGQAIIITATVTSSGPKGPTGFVDFYDNTTNTDLTPGGVAMLDGVATFNKSVLTANLNIMAIYSGDDDNLPSTSSVFDQIVNQPVIINNGTFNTTVTTPVSNLNPSVAESQPVPLPDTVTRSGDANITGEVDFFDNTDNKDLTSFLSPSLSLSCPPKNLLTGHHLNYI